MKEQLASKTRAIIEAADQLSDFALWMYNSMPYQAPETHRGHWEKLKELHDKYEGLRSI